MNPSIRSKLPEDKHEKGRQLQSILSDLTDEQKIAVIWFRCCNGELPYPIDLDNDMERMKIHIELNALANYGPAYLSEEDFAEAVHDIYEDNADVIESPEAWEVLTLLEVATNANYDNHYFEAYLYDGSAKINDVGVDLLGLKDKMELITCKFNSSNQHRSATKRLNQLHLLRMDLEDETLIGLGTLAMKLSDVVRNDLNQHLDEFELTEENIDKIITGLKIYDIQSH